MKLAPTIVALAILATGCTTAPAATGLKATCDALAPVMHDFGATVPDKQRYADYLPKVQALADAGDAETKDALAGLLAGFKSGAAGDSTGWLPLAGASAALVARCNAAGSTAYTTAPSSSPSPTVQTRYVNGVLRVPLDVEENAAKDNTAEGGACIPADGYTDMREGVDVTVMDGSGTTVGMGQLEAGALKVAEGGTTLYSGWCEYTFAVPDVPMGLKFYAISIGNRGKVNFTEAQIFGEPKVSLGKIPTK